MIIAAGTLKFADYFILVGYFALMLGVGAYFYRRMRAMKDYFSGGNRIPWWLSGVSYYMSCFSVFAFIAYAALAWEYGWLGVTVFWVMAPATLVSVVLFSRRWRRARIDSPVEYLEERYSPAVRQLFAWQNIPVRVIDDALKLVSIGIFISKGLDLDMEQAMLFSGLIMLAYTLMGGLWAVTVTDFLQFIVLLAAVAVLLPLSLAKAVDHAGGLGEVFTGMPQGFFNLTQPGYSWVYIGSNVLLFCLAFSSINWSLIQRYYCVPREKDALKVGWLVFVLNVLGPPLILLPVMVARHFLTGVEESGQVYPLLCRNLLPAGMLGLVIAAMFSATMSMLSSDYNVCAGVLTNDVYRRYVRPGARQKELVFIGRVMTFTIGVVSLGIAFLMAGVGGEDLFRNMVTLFSVAAAPVAIPMIAGLLTRRATNTGALAGFLAGILAGLATLLLCPDNFELFGAVARRENAVFLIAAPVTLIYTVLVSALDRPDESQRRRADAFLRRLEVPIGQAPEDAHLLAPDTAGAASPFGLVGLSTMIIGGMMLAVLPWVRAGVAFYTSLGVGLVLGLSGGLLVLMSRRPPRTEHVPR